MTPIREHAASILKQIPVPVRSNDGTDNYLKYTGLTHQQLLADWEKRPLGQDGLTGCNSFVGWYASKLGLGGGLAALDLQSAVRGLGKQHAWVASAAGKKPEFGDILHHSIPHTDVAMGFAGVHLKRMAAGQGGRKVGYDVLKLVTGDNEFSYTRLRGWIDIDKYLLPAPVVVPTPTWLQGWWSVRDGTQYYYFFGAGGCVQYIKTKPMGMAAPPPHPLNSGNFCIGPSGAVVIDWNPADGGATRETFSNARPGCSQMNGTSNRYAPLVADKYR